MAAQERVLLMPMPIRIWHWINALCIVTLCITGAQIRFPEYVNIFGTYKSAIMLHNTAGIIASVFFLVWLFYYVFVSRTLVKIYLPTVEDLKVKLMRQCLFYFFYFFFGRPNPHHPTPQNKFNPLQKTSYTAIMFVLVPLIILSGILLLNVAPLRAWVIAVGGLKLLVGAHFLIACCFGAFLLVHVYMSTLGHTPLVHIKEAWTGWEEVEEH